MSNTAEKKIETKVVSKEEEGGAEEADICCANCGTAEVDECKLEECDGCHSIRYCAENNECRRKKEEQHEEECKTREKDLHERKLFKQPKESHLGECPLCFLPMPLDPEKSSFYPCCSNYICNGCVCANLLINYSEEGLKCPFCREPILLNDEETHKKEMERIEANDPAALAHMGSECYNKGDYDRAIEYFAKAAELGDLMAHNQLGCLYGNGEGVEKDEEKEVYHLEQAAIGGHPGARHNLAVIEQENGKIERAVKHFIIAANLGDKDSMKALWTHYSAGNITKEDLDATLRTHHAAIDATKSEQREARDALLDGTYK
jgi:tetratricopeptide (TPR) repeat protein